MPLVGALHGEEGGFVSSTNLGPAVVKVNEIL